MTNKTLYHDTYTGPRWTYGLQYRPLDVATAPRDFIVFSPRPASPDALAQPDRYPHGVVDYARELTPEEVAGYQLVLVGRVSPSGEYRMIVPPRASHQGRWTSLSQPGDWWTDREVEDGYAPQDARPITE